MADPLATGRFLIAFDAGLLDATPVWTRIDNTANLVASYSIDRGRQYELDRTDTGRATVQITDPDGILDPTNPAGPYYGKIEPLLQATIGRQNPVTGQWHTRFRGWIENYDYRVDPSQQVSWLELSLVDIFEILSAREMLPGEFGETPPADSTGQVYFAAAWRMDDRINNILDSAGIPAALRVVFTGNVTLNEGVYSPGESVMTAIQEAADAEFPGVSNVYTDRLGRLCVHGRQAKFDPTGVASGATPGAWDLQYWNVGDSSGAALGYAQLRRFAFERGLSKVINQALATPVNIDDGAVTGQKYSDAPSISKYGVRSWSAQNLLTLSGIVDSSTALVETKRFAQYYVDNYKTPRNRVTDIQFRSIQLGAPGADSTWLLLSKADIADVVTIKNLALPGGGSFDEQVFFIEGVHETVRPLTPTMDDVTLTLDLSPKAYYDTNPFPTPP